MKIFYLLTFYWACFPWVPWLIVKVFLQISFGAMEEIMKIKFTQTYLAQASKKTIHNAEEVNRSEACRCFFCGYQFGPSEIDYIHSAYEPTTASCPMCGIDAVLGDASGFPINDGEFVLACSETWFNGISKISEGLPIIKERMIKIEVD